MNQRLRDLYSHLSLHATANREHEAVVELLLLVMVADRHISEDEIDEMNVELQPLQSFVLPGGSAGAAALHVARTVCRRAERIMVELAATPGEPVGAAALKYVNRLSDFLFVASRYVNDHGANDVLWVPGQNR